MEAVTLAQSIVANYGLTPLGITMYADPGGSTLQRHNNFEVRPLKKLSPEKPTFRDLQDCTCSQAWDVHSRQLPHSLLGAYLREENGDSSMVQRKLTAIDYRP